MAWHGLICDLCPDEMTQNHIVICPGRNVERNNLDMNNLDDLMTLGQFQKRKLEYYIVVDKKSLSLPSLVGVLPCGLRYNDYDMF